MKREKLQLYQTTIHTDKAGETRVMYYKTAIVTFNDETIILNTGGWWTRSTKARMNKLSWYFKLGFRVFQKEGVWFVEYGDEVHPYEVNEIWLDRETEDAAPIW